MEPLYIILDIPKNNVKLDVKLDEKLDIINLIKESMPESDAFIYDDNFNLMYIQEGKKKVKING